MRIISPFNDYYDSVQAAGQDLELQYLRNRQEIPSTNPFPKVIHGYRDWVSGFDMDVGSGVIAFCGKFYGYITLRVRERSIQRTPPAFCYNIKAADSFLEKSFRPKELAEYYRPKNSLAASRQGRKWPGSCSRSKFIQFFDAVANISNDSYREIFQQYHTPTFTHTDGDYREGAKLIINPRLHDVEFYRAVDPYQAFQEIQMFIGGMASPEKPIPHVSDADLAACKGFDKWSFRKPPSKKKK